MILLAIFSLLLLGSTSGDTLLPTWQVPFTQTSVLPASRVGASGIFNGSGILLTGGTVNTVTAQTVPMAPSSFYATGALCSSPFLAGVGLSVGGRHPEGLVPLS